MPNHLKYLVVGNLPNISLPTGHQVQATGNSDEDIETQVRDFDFLIISAVGEATDYHGFLLRVGEYNRKHKIRGKTIPVLVHHTSETATIDVNGRPQTWHIRYSMCCFGDTNSGDAIFVNTSTDGWQSKVLTWLKRPPRRSTKAA